MNRLMLVGACPLILILLSFQSSILGQATIVEINYAEKSNTKLKKNLYMDWTLCEWPKMKEDNAGNSALPFFNLDYKGDSLFMFLSECAGIPLNIVIQYDERFQFFITGDVSYAQILSEQDALILGTTHQFEMPPQGSRAYCDVMGFYAYCPIYEFYINDIGPEEANSFRNDFHWKEILYFKQHNVSSETANKYERPLRARDIVILANERPDIADDFVNECDYEKAENIIAVYDYEIPLDYANIAKSLVERYVDIAYRATNAYSIEDLLKDYKNGVTKDEIKERASSVQKPRW